MWGGRAVLHKVKTLRLRARCGNAAAGREGLCRGENDEGESWGNAEEARGNKNPAEPWGLRDERSNNIIY